VSARTGRVGWIDAGAGASGDMLLGALLGAGVPPAVLSDAVAAVAPEAVALSPERVQRGGLVATRCHVDVADSTTHRSWRDIVVLLAEADLAPAIRTRAQATFERLALAEAAVHGTRAEDVEFHEVGALDAIADVVGVCAGLEHLGLDALVVSPVAVGSGRVGSAHGSLPVPPPAVVELLRGVPSYAGPVASSGTQPVSQPVGELCTPTGAALLVSNATGWGPQPAMTVHEVGVGAGGRDPVGHANVVRLLVGDAFPPAATESGVDDAAITAPATDSAAASTGAAEDAEAPDPQARFPSAVVLETNVDDLDPRLWPRVLAALLAAGASDAWLTPILMKKGRPAHTLHVLVRPERLAEARAAVFRQTSTIGVREVAVGKTALDREMRSVAVAGHEVAVKLARLEGEVVNAQPEFEDVARVAELTRRPIKQVLAEAIARAQELS
jgi:uncharacterized protein (TIGR00299 family) protein